MMEVETVLRPGAVARAVGGAVGWAVGHQAGLQAAIAPHGTVQVQPGDQRLADFDALVPVDWAVVDAGVAALEAHSEHQVLLLHMALERTQRQEVQSDCVWCFQM